MLLCALFAMSAAIEAGVNQPMIGFNDLTAGVVIGFRLERDSGPVDLGLALQAAFYQGKNQAYTQQAYGLRFTCARNEWLFTPVLEAGPDYVRRRMGAGQETGFSFDYLLGLRMNLRYQLLTICPMIHFEGATDFAAHDGFIGAKIGIKHEL